MDTTLTALIETLRTFAIANNAPEFAHLCTAALAGEEWAVERLEAPLRAWAVANTMTPCTAMVDVLRSTDCARPDGAIARTFQP